MLSDRPAKLLAALRRTFPRWDCAVDGDHLTLTGGRGPHAYRPPRRPPDWPDMLVTLTDACAGHGIRRSPPLPLHGLGDAELTFSAVQALDPYLKYRQHHTWAHGFLPQPVVRFTGERDRDGALLPGFLTGFVNTSIVQPIGDVDEHAQLIDTWVGVLSALGFHARHLSITGRFAVWHRGPVAGITLRVHHDGLGIGDAVLLWNREDPSKLATDIGSGLERMRWALTRQPWRQVVYGGLADHAPPGLLDSIRTATLVVGAGVHPAPRRPGRDLRSMLRDHGGGLGLSRVVRQTHAYWSLVTPLMVPWPEVCRVLDTEVQP